MTAVDETTVAARPPLRRNRDFLLLWTGNWLQFFGSRMSSVCYPLLALQISGGSAEAVGLASAAASCRRPWSSCRPASWSTGGTGARSCAGAPSAGFSCSAQWGPLWPSVCSAWGCSWG